VAGLQFPIGSAPTPVINWIEIPEPPAEIKAWREARVNRLVPIFATMSAVLIGLVGAFAAVTEWRGTSNWSVTLETERFVIIALVIGVADFFFSRYFLRWIMNATNLHVRRLAISEGKLCLEMISGDRWNPPLKNAIVSPEAIAGGWFSVTIPAGRTAASCFVPGPVASTIRAAQGG
jgi:hypothetical protein